ncbi:S41 family peptidase [Caulobacter endophyticus]|uniref:S41 family peptidase n=1 Tax=Caulobacter endophyticus TaxID=2172652 RepID=UPI00240EF4FD|nr:S41 family peptidase [Caulobacter endophyticus]MDG2531827.1 S41 family peptidase [Caulobacter endophyticus]
MKVLAGFSLIAGLLHAAPVVAARADFRPTVETGAVAKPLQGVWRSRGYGWVVRFDASGSSLYHLAGDDCWRDPRPEADPDGVLKLWRPVGGAIETAGGADGTVYRFDRLKALPAACSTVRPWTFERTLAVVADTFQAYYPLSSERGLDWGARRRAAFATLGEAPDDMALWKALDVLLRGTNDAHVALDGIVGGRPRTRRLGEAAALVRAKAAPGGEAARARAWRADVLAAPLGVREAASGRILWGRQGEVGYLAVMAMGGFDPPAGDDEMALLDATLDEAMTAFVGAKAVIVDVSDNRGGYDVIARRIAARFADRRREIGSKVAVGGDGVAQALFIAPSDRPRYLGPVWLLTSQVTVSAGETFVLSMRALPNVSQAGEATRGALSDQLQKPLPNGWRFALPAEVHRDADGKVVEGEGVVPPAPLPVFPPDDPEGHAKALDRLLALIGGG